MVLEVAVLNVKSGRGREFEAVFERAQGILASMNGYVSHELQRCLEAPERYVLLVQWERLEDHTIGFRRSPRYAEWSSLLHSFYDPFPVVEHFERVSAGGQASGS